MMNFVNDFETGKKVILEKFPKFSQYEFKGDDSGWDNYAIFVNNEYLFRFPRKIEWLEQIKREAEVLSLLRPKLPTHIKVPEYLATELDDYPFVYYKMIPGEPLTRELYNNFDTKAKEKFTQNLAEFLNILHNINPENCKTLEKVDSLAKYQELYQQVREICFKYLTPAEQEKTEKLFANYFQNPELQNYTPTVVHGDLSENHILVTTDGIGVIDFGDTNIFDPAIDLSWFRLLSTDLDRELLAKYSAHKDAGFETRISQFYLPIIPYYGIIYGEEIQDQALINNELADLRENLAKL